MELFTQLWLPTLVSAVALFFVGFLAWVVLGVHKGDFRTLPDEMDIVKFVRERGIKPGHYFFPNLNDKAKAKQPEMKEIAKQGPYGTIAVFDPKRPMPLNMLFTFLINLTACVCIAYLASITIPRGAEFMHVFRVCGTAGAMTCIFGSLPNQIWFQSHTSTKVVTVLEGLVCGLTAGAIFAWLWPR
jgi:hypothetical protein